MTATFEYNTNVSRLGKCTRLLGGWGMRIFDYDNDGYKDLFFANSHVMDNIEKIQPHLEYLQRLLLLKQVNGAFVNVSAQSGRCLKRNGRAAARRSATWTTTAISMLWW